MFEALRGGVRVKSACYIWAHDPLARASVGSRGSLDAAQRFVEIAVAVPIVGLKHVELGSNFGHFELQRSKSRLWERVRLCPRSRGHFLRLLLGLAVLQEAVQRFVVGFSPVGDIGRAGNGGGLVFVVLVRTVIFYEMGERALCDRG